MRLVVLQGIYDLVPKIPNVKHVVSAIWDGKNWLIGVSYWEPVDKQYSFILDEEDKKLPISTLVTVITKMLVERMEKDNVIRKEIQINKILTRP